MDAENPDNFFCIALESKELHKNEVASSNGITMNIICTTSWPTKQLLRIVIVMLLLGLISSAATVKKVETKIDFVRQTSVLGDQHIEIITNFVNEQFDAMLVASDASELSEPVRKLVGNVASEVKRDEVRKIYSNHFSTAVKNAYIRISPQLNSLTDKNLAQRIKISATAALAYTNNINVIEDLVALLKDEAPEIRYWAARGLAMPEIQQYLISNEPQASSSAQNVLSELGNCLKKEDSPLVISQIVAAAPVQIGGVQLLQDCIAKRIEQYQNWTVNNELSDYGIFRKTSVIISSNLLADNKNLETKLIKSAIELFSVAYQRYTKGMSYSESEGSVVVELLTETSCKELATLLIEAEASLLLVSRSSRIASFDSFLPQKNWKRLEVYYKYLLRDVNDRFSIYPEGKNEPELPTVSDPPAQIIERAKNLKQIELDLS